MTSPRLDLGSAHWLHFTSWGPDRKLNPQYAKFPDVEKWGAIVGHDLRPDDGNEFCQKNGFCEGSITFDGPVQRQLLGGPFWQVLSWEPLTLSPSLLCHCGDHGQLINGRWVIS